MYTRLSADIHHVIPRMFFAVCGRLAAFNIKTWSPYAGVKSTTHAEDAHHAVRNMLLTVQPRIEAVDIEARFRHA